MTLTSEMQARLAGEPILPETYSVAASVARHPGGTGAWVTTYTGRRVDPVRPDPADIDLADIAHALAMTCRWAGHTRRFYSVAQHSVLVAHHVAIAYPDEPALAAAALLHDASEAYLCDIPRPVKHHASMAAYRALEATLSVTIAVRFGLPVALDPRIKTADNRMLVTEARQLIAGDISDWHLEARGEPYACELDSWKPDFAQGLFTSAAAKYGLIATHR